jgi:hypothetical protein
MFYCRTCCDGHLCYPIESYEPRFVTDPWKDYFYDGCGAPHHHHHCCPARREQICKNCRFWERNTPTQGKCRFYAPTIAVDQYGYVVGVFPAVCERDTCREWQEREGF